MKIKENITIYQCEHCSKVYQRENYCIEHENVCSKNPENIPACWNYCEHLVKKEFVEESYNGWDSYTFKGKSFYCKKKDMFMKPITSDKKGSEIRYECDTVDTVMPRECEDFETKDYENI